MEKKTTEKSTQASNPQAQTAKHSVGIEKLCSFKIGKSSYKTQVKATWMPLHDKNEKILAEMYYTSYALEKKSSEKQKRPLTIVFNGGPGAASAYLHLGAMGPKRCVFGKQGEILSEPSQLTDNNESWLPFTDLVFLDPIGTGLSRTIPKDPNDPFNKDHTKLHEHEKEYFQLNRDLQSIGEFIQKYLSQNFRWGDPIYIAGESYGGFRVAKLAKLLQEGFGVGLAGAILISPALEWTTLSPSDYDITGWSDLFPSMAASSFTLGKAKKSKAQSLDSFIKDACAFSDAELSELLILGEDMDRAKQKKILSKAADYLGLDLAYATKKMGRLHYADFCRQVLKDSNEVVGYYDATIRSDDPFPDREVFHGPDPTLFSIERIFSTGINSLLRQEFGLKTDRAYELLSMEVNTAWKIDDKKHALDLYIGATDDLRYAMSLNSSMKVYMTHGYYDLVTPFHAANRIRRLMKLSPNAKKKFTVKHYEGGHMFYSWEKSRVEFTKDLRDFYL